MAFSTPAKAICLNWNAAKRKAHLFTSFLEHTLDSPSMEPPSKLLLSSIDAQLRHLTKPWNQPTHHLHHYFSLTLFIPLTPHPHLSLSSVLISEKMGSQSWPTIVNSCPKRALLVELTASLFHEYNVLNTITIEKWHTSMSLPEFACLIEVVHSMAPT